MTQWAHCNNRRSETVPMSTEQLWYPSPVPLGEENLPIYNSFKDILSSFPMPGSNMSDDQEITSIMVPTPSPATTPHPLLLFTPPLKRIVICSWPSSFLFRLSPHMPLSS